jgi:hypothetical protein
MTNKKMLDEQTRRTFQAHPRYHRLTTKFQDGIPRLDEVSSIQLLKSKVDQDQALVPKIDSIVQYLFASLFYFELDAVPEMIQGKYIGSGYIMCSIRHNDPAFTGLFKALEASSAQFWIDGSPAMNIVEKGGFGPNRNFRKRVDLSTHGRFDIALKQNDFEACSISGSPFTVARLVELQGLKAAFGRPGDNKRKRDCKEGTQRKKQRVY